jgi:CheY-like chemotaxis protein
MKILVVDDELTILSIIRRTLEAHGHEIEQCSNGTDAVNMILKGKYDIVLLDYSMPAMQGTDVCESVREEEGFKDLPIIILTAYTNKPDDFFKDSGATDVLYKPVDTDKLLEMLEKHKVSENL